MHPDVERTAVRRLGFGELALVAQQAGQAVERYGEAGIARRQALLLDRQCTAEEGLRFIESPELPVGLAEIGVDRRHVGMRGIEYTLERLSGAFVQWKRVRV